ncbi:MAG TPA: hypothetical protein VN781_04195 [Acidimicrobiales bacterium]|nr:hypothetical protein [Acidimicrobiales bacterium]
MQIGKAAVGVALVGGVLFGAAPAFGVSAPVGTPLKVFVLPGNAKVPGAVVLTGAVGDYGKAVNVNSAGKPDKKGPDGKFLLKKGTITLDLSQLKAAAATAKSNDFNTTTCSASVTFSAPAAVLSGTKAYAQITGSLTLTETGAFVLPFKGGKCNASAAPSAQWEAVTGSGTVTFG